jgi:hypothetical protein
MTAKIANPTPPSAIKAKALISPEARVIFWSVGLELIQKLRQQLSKQPTPRYLLSIQQRRDLSLIITR